MTHNIFWTASLSDGSTIYEGKGEYAIEPGQLSPWQRLRVFLNENPTIKITSLSLYTNDNRRFNLPSAGRNPKFKIFAESEQPTGYNFKRLAGIDFDMAGKQEGTEIYAIIEAIYATKTLQMWVSDSDTRNCWSVIV